MYLNKKFSKIMTFLTFHIWFLLQNRICLPQQLHTAWRHINITFLKKKIVLLEGPILRISFIKGSPDLLKIKKMKHKYTLNWINVKYTQVDLLRLKWRFLQRASSSPKSNAPCWQTLDRHLVIRHQKSRGEREWLLRVREREGNWKSPFPKFGNGKGIEKAHSRNSGTGRE